MCHLVCEAKLLPRSAAVQDAHRNNLFSWCFPAGIPAEYGGRGGANQTIVETFFAKPDVGWFHLLLVVPARSNLFATKKPAGVLLSTGRMFGFTKVLLATSLLSIPLCASAGDKLREPAKTTAALDNPHTVELQLAANKKRAPGNIEKSELLDLTPGLVPLTFPKNTDVRALILTPQLKRTPLVGWIATNLYRDPSEKGWCLEADPGQGEYVLRYRLHLK